MAAQELGLKVLQPVKVRVPEFAQELKSLEPDWIVVVAYGRILSPGVLAVAPCVNVHFSLLPKYRGASCVAYALINGEKETGTTTLLIDEGLDSGPILMQWTEALQAEDTTETVSLRLAELGARQIVQTLAGLEQGKLKPVPQKEEDVSLAPLLTKELGQVNWDLKVEEIYNLYRGLTSWPGIYGFLEGRRILLSEVRPDSAPATGEPGTLEVGSKEELLVNCGEGRLRVLKLKPEGKRVLSAAEFVRGLQRREGLKFK